jgi:hypothetical protein
MLMTGDVSIPASALGLVVVVVLVDVAVEASIPASCTVAVPVEVPVATSIPASRAVAVAVDVETPPSGMGCWQVAPVHASGALHGGLPAQHGWPAAPQATQLPVEQMVSPMQVLLAQHM